MILPAASQSATALAAFALAFFPAFLPSVHCQCVIEECVHCEGWIQEGSFWAGRLNVLFPTFPAAAQSAAATDAGSVAFVAAPAAKTAVASVMSQYPMCPDFTKEAFGGHLADEDAVWRPKNLLPAAAFCASRAAWAAMSAALLFLFFFPPLFPFAWAASGA